LIASGYTKNGLVIELCKKSDMSIRKGDAHVRVAAILSALVRHWEDFWIIVTLLLLNASVGFWQEHKADNAIELLKQKLDPKARGEIGVRFFLLQIEAVRKNQKKMSRFLESHPPLINKISFFVIRLIHGRNYHCHSRRCYRS
jgi:hypothetical protein